MAELAVPEALSTDTKQEPASPPEFGEEGGGGGAGGDRWASPTTDAIKQETPSPAPEHKSAPPSRKRHKVASSSQRRAPRSMAEKWRRASPPRFILEKVSGKIVPLEEKVVH